MRKLVGIAVTAMLLTSLPVPAAASAVSPAKPSDFNGEGTPTSRSASPGTTSTVMRMRAP